MSRLGAAPAILVILLLLSSLALSQKEKAEKAISEAQSHYRLRTTVMGSSGDYGTSGQYKTAGTLGQPTPIGIGSASDKELRAGFWGRYWIPTPVEETPVSYRNMLFQNFPNPFNPSTTIEYSVAIEGNVEITIFNVKGQRIRTLVNESQVHGRYKAVWDGKNEEGRMVTTGIYFYRLKVDTYSAVKKMLLLR